MSDINIRHYDSVSGRKRNSLFKKCRKTSYRTSTIDEFYSTLSLSESR